MVFLSPLRHSGEN
uniref:Uncharacterized protein n=1 Tax=Anguilla anguilla TaxID=7936 RepID=A0A0E9SCP9_ANGAN